MNFYKSHNFYLHLALQRQSHADDVMSTSYGKNLLLTPKYFILMVAKNCAKIILIDMNSCLFVTLIYVKTCSLDSQTALDTILSIQINNKSLHFHWWWDWSSYWNLIHSNEKSHWSSWWPKARKNDLVFFFLECKICIFEVAASLPKSVTYFNLQFTLAKDYFVEDVDLLLQHLWH